MRAVKIQKCHPYLELLPRDVEDHVLDVVLRHRDEVEHVVAHQVDLSQLRRRLLQSPQRFEVHKDLQGRYSALSRVFTAVTWIT